MAILTELPRAWQFASAGSVARHDGFAATAAEEDMLATEVTVDNVDEVDAAVHSTLAFRHVTSVAPDERPTAFVSVAPVRHKVAPVKPGPLSSGVRALRQVPAWELIRVVAVPRLAQTP